MPISGGLNYRKSTDGGISFGAPVQIISSLVRDWAVWYDRWSNISADLIHIAYIEATNHDVRYKNLDASSDTLSSETVIFNGASVVNPVQCLSITRAIGGNLYCLYGIDGGTERGFARSTDVGATWGARSDTGGTESDSTDEWIMMPGWNADTQDVMAFYWDASANEISVKRHDDSANTWAEASIATSMTDRPPNTSGDYPHFAAAVDLTNSQNLVCAWSAVDTANADLRCWKVTDSAITETAANVVLNSTDDQGLAAISIETSTGDWYVFYAGESGGSETFQSKMKIYYKRSTDGGATWGAETALTNNFDQPASLFTNPRHAGASGTPPPLVAFFSNSSDDVYVRAALSIEVPVASTGMVPVLSGALQ